MTVFWVMFGKLNAKEVFLKKDFFPNIPNFPIQFPKIGQQTLWKGFEIKSSLASCDSRIITIKTKGTIIQAFLTSAA